MDAPAVDPLALRRALMFIRRVNRWLGYTRATLSHFDAATRDWPPGRALRVLDVATGSADVPEALRNWAKKRLISLDVVGLDLHAATLAVAAAEVAGVALVRGDALSLPFEDRTFDIVTSSMFLHHLPTPLAEAALREMKRVASHQVIVADLLRSRRAYGWITLFTLPTGPLVRHDARVSVKQAFTIEEMQSLAASAGFDRATVHRHAGHRFVMTAAVS
ncbi:MAG TPA: methyltransferase domain-containing protein [Tepidisphaeraceae bacterium]